MRHLHGMTERFNQGGDSSSPKRGLVLDAKLSLDGFDDRLPQVGTSLKRMNVEKYQIDRDSAPNEGGVPKFYHKKLSQPLLIPIAKDQLMLLNDKTKLTVDDDPHYYSNDYNFKKKPSP